MKNIIYFLVIINCAAFSQTDKYGVLFDYNMLFHSANFQKLPDVPNCCPKFETGSGSGITLGILYEMPLYKDLSFMLRLVYSNQNGNLTDDELKTISVDGNAVLTGIRHTLNFDFGSILAQPMLNYNLYKFLNLSAGLSFGAMTQQNFKQSEVLVDRGAFVGKNTNIRNDISGTIKNATSISLQFLVGLNADFPLNKKGSLFLSPEIYYGKNLLPLVKDLTWNYYGFFFGLALKYSPPVIEIKEQIRKQIRIDTIKIPEEDISKSYVNQGKERFTTDTLLTEDTRLINQITSRTDTLFIQKPVILTAEVNAVGVEQDNTESSDIVIRNEEFLSSTMKPLLNYVFFDYNSAQLPERYKSIPPENTGNFNINNLFDSSTLATYYDVLNIIGKRLTEHPKADLTIIGCNSNLDLEKGNTSLSQNRADAVATYLKYVWKIDSKRIKMQSRNLPDIPSNSNEADGIIENRRAEIYSNDPSITAPLFLNDTLHLVKPMTIRFEPKAEATKGVKQWKISISYNGRVHKELSGTGEINSKPVWQISEDKDFLKEKCTKIEYTLQVTDNSGRVVTTQPKYIPVDEITIRSKKENLVNDKRIDNYSLILFDFDKKDINKPNREIINFVNKNIESNSTVNIAGYTDRMGEDDYNQSLSDGRAKSVERAITSGSKSSMGVGESKLLFTNELPEGRFYCRTVLITVETPINK
ncbi:MAG: OmpA/MotB domain protein [Ignavibacteria bacterium]|nr:OmpA/MotB domain protein [Ignavibacteria bacterium]